MKRLWMAFCVPQIGCGEPDVTTSMDVAVHQGGLCFDRVPDVVRIEGCEEGEPAELRITRDRVEVWVQLNGALFEPESSAPAPMLTWSTDAGSANLSVTPQQRPVEGDDGIWWRAEFEVPSPVSDTSALIASVAGLEVATVLLGPVVEPSAVAVDITFDGAASPPPRARFEAEACRDASVDVSVEEEADFQTEVTLAATAGLVGSNGLATATELLIPTQPTAFALQLPLDGTLDEIELTVTGEGLQTRRVRWDFLPVLPEAGGELEPAVELVVGSTGSGPSVVRGRLVVPDGVVLVGSEIYVTMVATADDAELSCGTPVSPASLDCDPRGLEGDVGGFCGLVTTATLTPLDAAEGLFQIPIRSGICFSGTVTVRAYAPTLLPEESSDSCIGERVPAEGMLPTAIGESQLRFVPAIDDGSSDL